MSADTDRSKRYTWTGDDDMEVVEEGTGKAINIEDLIAASKAVPTPKAAEKPK